MHPDGDRIAPATETEGWREGVKVGARLDAALRKSPAQARYAARARQRLAVLAYHSIADSDRFAAHLDYLVSHSQAVSLDDVARAVERDQRLPERAVLVTFDDSDPSILEVAAPLLQERHVPAAAFVVAGLIGTSQPFWWDEVTQLARGYTHSDPGALVHHLKTVPNGERLAALDELRAEAPAVRTTARQLTAAELVELGSHGVAIGSHSLTHPCLDRCEDDVLDHELAASKAALEDFTGEPVVALAYPNGNYDARVVDAADRAGYKFGFLFDHRISDNPPSNALAISRVRVNSWTSLDRLATITSGLHPAVHHAIGRG